MIDTLPQALFLDRDGTLIKWVDYLHDPESVELEPGIADALKRAKAAGCLLFIHTNQSGVGRGYFGMEAVHAVNARMFELMGVEEAFFDGVCIAPDDPDCLETGSYRKPSPRYELEMIEKYELEPQNCYFLGDNLCDVETGFAAEIQSVCVGNADKEGSEWRDAKDRGVSFFSSVASFVSECFFGEEEVSRARGSLASILIVARNAEGTIERAVASAVCQGGYPVILVDDCSEDNTVEVARRVGGEQLKVVEVGRHMTLGAARQEGLMSLDTEFCFLLDADDEFLPSRVDRLLGVMRREKSDAVFDELQLIDGRSGEWLKDLEIPSFIEKPEHLCRLFERNYLPGIGQMGFRVEPFKELGYDSDLHGPEDSDLVLRALARGLRFSLCREIGYKMYHYDGSVSRNLERQKRELTKVLGKHDYDDVYRIYQMSGMSKRITFWGLYALSVFRLDWVRAVEYIRRIEELDDHEEGVLEIEGPFPFDESWRIAYAKGVLALVREAPEEALRCLIGICSQSAGADVLNNLGVANAMLGRFEKAGEFFRRALENFPGYLDAQHNLNDPEVYAVTHLPLRTTSSRNVYKTLVD